ncbi:MAG: hypothetical protein WBI53_13375 [Paludibacter sp.]
MKKYVMLALVAIFTMSFALNAQEQRPPRGERDGQRMQITAKERAEHLSKKLELTDAEKAKVQALYEKQDKDREMMRAEAQKKKAEAVQNREEMRAQFEERRKAEDVELEKIIGKEKFEKLQKIRAERQEKMKARREEKGQKVR